MIDPEILPLVAAKDRWMVLTTMGPDGFPHSVPLGYFFVDDRVVMGCKDGTQKVRNVERESKVCLLWENGRGKGRLIGAMIRGQARVVRDQAQRLALKQEAARQRGEDIPISVGDGFVYIEIRPVKTVTWNRPTR